MKLNYDNFCNHSDYFDNDDNSSKDVDEYEQY